MTATNSPTPVVGEARDADNMAKVIIPEESFEVDDGGRLCFFQRNLATPMTVGGIRQSSLALTSTAVGGGVLAMAYVLSISGVILGVSLLALGGSLAYLGTVSLIELSASTGCDSYAALFSHYAGSVAGPVLDSLLFIYGNGACVGYLIFLGDFVPPLVELTGKAGPGENAPMSLDTCRTLAILVWAACVALPSVQKDVSVLRHAAPLSIIALFYIAIVLVIFAPSQYHKHSDSDGPIEYFKFNISLIEAWPMCLFAYNCHMNVVSVGGALIRPTRVRIKKVAVSVNILQCLFYFTVGLAGYVSFLGATQDNIIKNYAANNPWIAAGRAILTVVMLVAIPSNLVPTVQCGLRLFCARSRMPTSLPAEELIETESPAEMETHSAAKRVALGLMCIAVQAAIAIFTPGIKIVISLMGATIATAMMLIIPAYLIHRGLPHSRRNLAKKIALLFFSLVALASVPVSLFHSSGA